MILKCSLFKSLLSFKGKVFILLFFWGLSFYLLRGVEDNALSFQNLNLPPSLHFPFGSNWLGRDVFKRTLLGLSESFKIGILAGIFSSLIALLLGVLGAYYDKTWGRFLDFLLDLFLSLPHIVLLILLSFIFRGGELGITLAIGLTHWPSLARIIRHEVFILKNASFFKMSFQFGKGPYWRLRRHIFPLLYPQMKTAFLLLFPKAILHEASLTFLGFGLPPDKASIGGMLVESLLYLNSGIWWAILFPGLALVFLVKILESLGGSYHAFET